MWFWRLLALVCFAFGIVTGVTMLLDRAPRGAIGLVIVALLFTILFGIWADVEAARATARKDYV